MVLGDLAQAGPEFSLGQRGQRRSVADHATWLPERTDQIFAFGQVHPGLATNGSVDLPQKGGGHIERGDTPVIDRSCETSNIGHDASAHPDNDVITGHTPLGETSTQCFDRRQSFVLLTVADDEGLLFDASLHLDGDAGLGHDCGTAGFGRNQGTQLGHRAVSNNDAVAAVGQLNRNDDHDAILRLS